VIDAGQSIEAPVTTSSTCMQYDALGASRAYWKKTLTALPVLQLPNTRAHLRIENFSEATQAIELPLDLCNALKALNDHRDYGAFITLLTAFKVLLRVTPARTTSL
jgi:hypothetical protein